MSGYNSEGSVGWSSIITFEDCREREREKSEEKESRVMHYESTKENGGSYQRICIIFSGVLMLCLKTLMKIKKKKKKRNSRFDGLLYTSFLGESGEEIVFTDPS